MNNLVRKIQWVETNAVEPDLLLEREWLVTNGLGGYASGTVSGVVTRRYHGLLIAALPPPLGRTVMLNHLSEQLKFPDGECLSIGGEDKADKGLEFSNAIALTEFRLETGLPIWRYQASGIVLEKYLLLSHRQNTVYITYRLLSGDSTIRLRLSPLIQFRAHETPVHAQPETPYTLTVMEDQYEVSLGAQFPPLRMRVYGQEATYTIARKKIEQIFYRAEERRGYAAIGDLWSPGYFEVDLLPGREATLIASTEPWEVISALPPTDAFTAEQERRTRLLALAHPQARTEMAAELVLAADQFIVTPGSRGQDTARTHAAGDEVRTVFAGYHWFTDWGRDTMISLEGLTLITGRHLEAGWILRTFAASIRDGLIPNLFPEGERKGLYHTADATLWFFHAIDRYLQVTRDRATLMLLLPKLIDIIDHHLHGTHFGIGVDPQDGLLRQGQEDYQLTWMDAKVDNWVVTPRRGKAVEINALWYNALRLLEQWVREERGAEAARSLGEHAERARKSFNERFWCEQKGHLYDVIDGEQGPDAACRPNQLLAISLPHPILDQVRWKPVLEVARQRLLTPVGLRSLAPGEADYKAKYFGDLRSRDAAYHQGTVWAWLIGPFIDAWLRVYPKEYTSARKFLEGFGPHLAEACIGSISEIFDADAPFTPRGCIAQAWSVAEVLRCWVKTAD